MRTMMTKKGSKMAFISLDDGTGRVEIALFSNTYEQNRHLLAKGKLILISGEVSIDEFSGGYRVRANEVMDIESARQKFAKGLLIQFSVSELPADSVEKLKSLLHPYRYGECPVCLDFQCDGVNSKVILGKEWRVTPQPPLILSLREFFGAEAVTIRY